MLGTLRRIILAPVRVYWKPTSTPRIIASASGRKDNESVVIATDTPTLCGASRWSADYAALGGPGDARGRKSGAGRGTGNSS